MTQESWKSWPEQPDVEASNLGRIRSAGRVLTPRASMAYVPGSVKSSMYPKVRVRRPDGTRWWVAVHRIVCDAWLGPCLDGWHRAHLNGDVRDNRLVNLAIVPARVNMVEHRIAQGHTPIYRLSDEDIQRGLEMYARPGVSVRDVERALGVGGGTFAYHVDRMGIAKPRRGKLTRAQQEEAAQRIKAGERVRAVARAMNMSEVGLANNLRLAGLLDIATPRQPLQVMDDTRAAIVAERERGDKIIDIARRHGVSVSQVVKFSGTRRKNRPSVVGALRDEVHRAALEMTPKELAARFNLPKGTAYKHHSKARHDAQTNAAQAS